MRIISKCAARSSVLCALVLVASCVEEDVESPDVAPVPDETLFVSTVVELRPDGTSQVGEPQLITAGEQRAQNEWRHALERGEAEPPSRIVRDTSCPGDAVWLYARQDFTGDRICFSGAGFAKLENYVRYSVRNGQIFYEGDWRLTGASVWPGVLFGRLQTSNPSVGYSWWSWGDRTFFGPESGRMEMLVQSIEFIDW